jgi:hypothetical protein
LKHPIKHEGAKKEITLLLLSFCIIVGIKSILSLRFHSPWLLPDEVSYAKMAADIFGSTYSDLPRAYPFLLSVAYLSSDDMMVVYHWMLIINSFISSLIIFPSYYILSKYCSREFSCLGAIIVATLPSVNLYAFLIMSENLFVPLFVFSIWFLLEAYETEKPFWVTLSILSASLLFFTRHSGALMIVAIVISLMYYLHSGSPSGFGKNGILINYIYLIFIALFVSSLLLFAVALAGSDLSSYLNWFWLRAGGDLQIFLDLFGDFSQLRDYLIMLRNEVGYLILASYFILLFILICFFYDLFFKFNKKSGCLQNSWFNFPSQRSMTSLKSVGIYYIASSFILLFATTLSAYWLQRVMGRYLNPLIPGLFLFGLIGLYRFREVSAKPNFKLITISAIVFTLIFFFRYQETDLEAIYYLNFMEGLAPSWVVIPALTVGFFFLLNIYKNNVHGEQIFFALLIIFSVCTSAYTYQADLVFHSDANSAQNQIGNFLNAYPEDDVLLVFDENISREDWYFETMTKFWTKNYYFYYPINEIINYSLDEDLSYFGREESKMYLITSEILPFKPLAVSTRGYYLYNYTSDGSY